MFYLQAHLQNGSVTLDSLKNDFAISAKRHPVYPNLVHFSYSTLFSPKTNPIVRDSRGTILDEDNNWEIVCHPYYKFFNYCEEAADPIDWKNARVLEKEDGTLVNLWFYDGKWHISTNGSVDASGALSGITPTTFADLFWKTWNDLGYKLPHDTDCTYMFELMSPLNQVVVNQTENRIVHHGVKYRSGMESHTNQGYNIAYNWEIVDSYPLETAEEVIEWAAKLDGRKSEGFVVVDNGGYFPDGSFTRLKFKSPDYCQLHYARKNGVVTRKDLMKVLLEGEGSEFLSYNETYRTAYDELSTKFQKLIDATQDEFDRLNITDNMKQFASTVSKSWMPQKIAFDLKRGVISKVEEGYVSMGAGKALKFLDEWPS